MAFRGYLGTIAAGASVRVFYRLSSGSDLGAQYAMAYPLKNDNTLKVNDQTKKREADGSTTYLVTVTNIGGTATDFDVAGGGLT